MTNRGEARRASRGLAVATLTGCLAACASAPPVPEGGLFVTPKANKHYTVDGETIPFSVLETRLANESPSRIVIETTRQRQGAACVVMLGLRLGIPVWTRSLNGRMQELKSDVKTDEVATIESCR